MNNILFKTVMLKGEKGETGAAGTQITSIEKTATVGLIDTYTITLSDGTTQQFEIKNGEDAQLYEIPQDSIIAYDGEFQQVTETSDNTNVLVLDNVAGITSIKNHGYTQQNNYTGKNKFAGTVWENGYMRDGDGVYVARTTGNNDVACQTFSSVEAETTYIMSWGGWSSIKPSILNLYYYSNSTAAGFISHASVRIYAADETIQFTTPANCTAFRIYFHGSGNYAQYIPQNLQVEKGTVATSYEPYVGGVASPAPDYPQPINGLGDLQQDNTYSFNLTVADDSNNTYTLTVAGLSAPVYAGDIIDLLGGTVTRVNGIIDVSALTWVKYSSEPGIFTVLGSTFPNKKEGIDNLLCNVYRLDVTQLDLLPDKTIRGNRTAKNIYIKDLDFLTAWQNNTPDDFKNANAGNYIVYELETAAAPEPVTITGDISAIQNIIGSEITITAPAAVKTVEATFNQDTGTPPGYVNYPAQWDPTINPASNWAPETRAVYEELYFKNGDEIITGDNVDSPAPLLLGHCTATFYRVVMQLPKRLTENQTVTVEQLSSMQIFTNAGSSYVSPGTYGIGVKIVRELNQLRITFSPATTDPDRGGFCAISGQFKITITEEV